MLLRDVASNVVDFVAASALNPSAINNPVIIVPTYWQGSQVPAVPIDTTTYQRFGSADSNTSNDWRQAANSIGVLNSGLLVPFAGGKGTVEISPTNSGSFAAGVWSGTVSVLEPISNMWLRADDDTSHFGTTTQFTVEAFVDLAVTMIDTPDPVLAGDNLTYSITVTNNGPDRAKNAVLTNALPTGVTFVSAASSQGTCTQVAGIVKCNLGVLSNAASAIATIVVQPTVAGVLSNTVTITSSAADSNMPDNVATTVTTVQGVGVLGVASGTNVCQVLVGNSSAGQAFGTVTAGNTYLYTALGMIARDTYGCYHDPDGNVVAGSCSPVTNAPAGFLCPGLKAISLVAKINGGSCLQLGTSGSFVAPASGNLILYCNDVDYSDNSGSWIACVIAPSDLASAGPAGGPFTPASQVYSLTNSGSAGLDWSVNVSQNWLTFSAVSGALAAGASTNITATINSDANSLGAGVYSNTVTFINLTNGHGTTTRSVALTVIAPATLAVAPASGLISTGPQGGPFAPSNQVYTLSNSGSSSLNWSASKSAVWLSLSATNGSLVVGSNATVTVSINASANGLGAGSYSDTVTFTNTTNGNGTTTRPVTLTVMAPANLAVTPGAGLSSTGVQGGPFSPASQDYTLSNTGSVSLNWSANKNANWLTLSANSGALPPGGSALVTVSVNTNANELDAGNYSDSVTFTNTTNGKGTTTRPVTLTVMAPANLAVTPSGGVSPTGIEGGPFSPSSQDYTLSNTGSVSLNWSVDKSANWVTLSANSGALPPGGSALVTVSVNTNANELGAGNYSDSVTFTNTTNGNGTTTRSLILRVLAPSRLTVAPAGGLDSVGPQWGPFSPSSQDYTLSNTGSVSLNWSANKNANWVVLSASNGTLAGGANTTVTVSINSNADDLAIGNYLDTVTFTNRTNGLGSTNRAVNLAINLPAPTTILADAGNLFANTTNNLAPSNSIAVLVVDTGNNGFVDPQPSFPLSPGATWGTDDRIVGLWDLSNAAADYGDGQLYDQTVVAYTNGIARGQKIQLYWFPSLTLVSNTVGVTYYGKYTDTNNPALDGSDAWQMPKGGSFLHLRFWTEFWGGSNPETAGLATLFTGAQIAVSPTNDLDSMGGAGGPFGPLSQVYALTNIGQDSLSWAVSKSQSWVSLSATSGTLPVGGRTNVTVSINDGAKSLVAGSYSDTITFTNTTNGIGTTDRSITLTISKRSPTVIIADAGDIFASTTNSLAPTGSVAVLVIDTGNNGFADPQPAFPLSLGATWGTDDRVIGLWDLAACDCGEGQLFDQTVVAYANRIAPGQKLQLYWFPSLTLASNTVGTTYYGKYTDTNNPALDGSDAWQMTEGRSIIHLKFWTAFWGGSNPETAGLATLFTGGQIAISPTNGLNSTGNAGGPFGPSSQVYALTNVGADGLNWAASNSQSWVSLSATSGMLSVGASTNITVSINAVANDLTAGAYLDTVTFTNVTDGIGTTSLGVSLTVGMPLLSTILADAGNLFDRWGNLAPSNSIAVLVVDTGNNGFVDPRPTFPLSLGATWGTDDRIVGLWNLTAIAADYGEGQLFDQTVVAYTNGVAPGEKLQLYWFPSLTLASNTVGVTYYGKYTDTNSPPLDDSDEWQMPVSGSNVRLKFWTAFWGGSNPETAGRATLPTGAYQNWQMQHFGCTDCPQAADDADPDGDGQKNIAEFLAGTDPTSAASAFRILSLRPEGDNVRITWAAAGGRTNAVQAALSDADGCYTTNFIDLSGPIIILGSGDTSTNYLDAGGATNAPARFYRIRLVP